jgi:ribosomal protein S18 acetylase RimI-like enzyme
VGEAAVDLGHGGRRYVGTLAGVPEFSIRVATPSEGDEVGRLTERVYRADGFLDGDEDYADALRDGAGRVRDAVVLVAVTDAGIVGAVTLAEAGTSWSNIATADELEVRMLVVDHPARRQGVADALMDAAEDHAVRRGLSAVVLSTEPVMVGAHALYERRGYARQPERDWAVGSVSLLAYRRPLA